MQTFLPYPDFHESARCLDSKRLGKQRVESWQIYCALTVPGYGWQNHPTVRMWKNFEDALRLYGWYICLVWRSKGYKDSLLKKFDMKRKSFVVNPSWLGNEHFHSTHRAILLAKNYDWYKQFGWSEKPAEKVNGKWPYVWPV